MKLVSVYRSHKIANLTIDLCDSRAKTKFMESSFGQSMNGVVIFSSKWTARESLFIEASCFHWHIINSIAIFLERRPISFMLYNHSIVVLVYSLTLSLSFCLSPLSLYLSDRAKINAIYWEQIIQLLSYYIDVGIEMIFISGTTSEFTLLNTSRALTREEKRKNLLKRLFPNEQKLNAFSMCVASSPWQLRWNSVHCLALLEVTFSHQLNIPFRSDSFVRINFQTLLGHCIYSAILYMNERIFRTNITVASMFIKYCELVSTSCFRFQYICARRRAYDGNH